MILSHQTPSSIFWHTISWDMSPTWLTPPPLLTSCGFSSRWRHETRWRPGRGRTDPCRTPRRWSSPSCCRTGGAAASCPRRPAPRGAERTDGDVRQTLGALRSGLKQERSSHSMSVEVGGVFVAGGLVAAVGGGPCVHEPETNRQNINNSGAAETNAEAEAVKRCAIGHSAPVTANSEIKITFLGSLLRLWVRLASTVTFHIGTKSTEPPRASVGQRWRCERPTNLPVRPHLKNCSQDKLETFIYNDKRGARNGKSMFLGGEMRITGNKFIKLTAFFLHQLYKEQIWDKLPVNESCKKKKDEPHNHLKKKKTFKNDKHGEERLLYI